MVKKNKANNDIDSLIGGSQFPSSPDIGMVSPNNEEKKGNES